MIIIKRIETPELIEDACALLYKTLVEQANWKFSPDNPSQLRVEMKNNRCLLIDRFTENAVWFGAFDNSRLIGCTRLTSVDENNQLEMERYKNSAIIQEYLPIDKSRCVELTRAAVLRNHNGLSVRIRDLFLHAFRYCEENKYSVCAASHNGHIVALFKKIGYPLKMEYAFKYEEQDSMPVNFYFADYAKSEVKNMILRLETYKRDMKRKKTNIFDALDIVAPILPTPVYWHDTNGVVLGLNARCLKQIGATMPLIGKTPYEFYPKDIAEHILNHNEQVMKTGEVLSQDEEIEDIQTGKTKIFRSIKAPLYNDEGSIIGIIGSSIDITKERQAEILKTEFVRNMQHDIRTPAAGICGLLDSLMRSETNPERKKVLKMATESSKRLLSLCNDAVEFGDLEENSKPVMQSKIDIRDIAKGIVELNLPAVFERKLTLNFKVTADVPKYIINDPFRLSRILLNLLGNAIKFTDKGEVSLNLSARNNEDDRYGLLVIEVKDTGVGISRDKIETVFQKFSRGVASNTNKYPGTGLGLYIVRTFVDELEGDIEIESHEGIGSYFILTIPFKTPLLNKGQVGSEINEEYRSPLNDALKSHHASSTANNGNKHHQKNNIKSANQYRVLIIEDDPVCLFVEKQIVSDFTKHIDTAESMKHALEMLAINHYDIVISDLGLPDGTGVEIATTIRASSQSPNKKTPFIAVTAHRDKEKHQEALNAGFTYTCTKPLTQEKVQQLFDVYSSSGKEKSENERILDLEIIDLE